MIINTIGSGGDSDKAEQIGESIIPYSDYWWRRRNAGTSYYEVQDNAKADDKISRYHSVYDKYYYYILITDTESSRTIKYSQSINIDQSTGTVSLANPTSVTVSQTAYTNTQLTTMLSGKYVTGLLPSTSKVFYIPSGVSVITMNWNVNGTDYIYRGYEEDNNTAESRRVKVITSKRSDTVGDWEYVSSASSDTYPHDDVLNGMKYEYLGTVKDMALSANNAKAMTEISYTSANFSNGLFNIDIPCDNFVFMVASVLDGNFRRSTIIGFASKKSQRIIATTSYVNETSYSNDFYTAQFIGKSIPMITGSTNITEDFAVLTDSGISIKNSPFRNGTFAWMAI